MGQRTCTTAISLTLALTLAAHSAEAALRNRTFVSGNGLDTNPCSVAQPCRTFAFAITQTAPGGGITILDPANYGPVTISQAISIINEGIGEASVQTTSAVDAITVSAGTTDNVILRGLNLVGLGIGLNGINIETAGKVDIQNCTINGFTKIGINFDPTIDGSFKLAVSDTIVSGNADFGIQVKADSAGRTANAFFERVQSLNNLTGFNIQSVGTIHATAADSVAAHNSGTGFRAGASAGSFINFLVANSKAVNNGTGITATGSVKATISLSQSIVSGNATGFVANSGAVIMTYQNNVIEDFTSAVGSLTNATLQ